MAAWTGWEALVLADLGVPDTAANVRFLATWHTYEGSNCANNPLNTTLRATGSTKCNSVGVQSYPSHAVGARATADTLKGGFYGNILSALQEGDPFAYPSAPAVGREITTWGTPNFAAWYLSQSTTGQPIAGTVSTPAPSSEPIRATGGWNDLSRSLAAKLPNNLKHSQVLRQDALRTLRARGMMGRSGR
jgi:hypothetical protein